MLDLAKFKDKFGKLNAEGNTAFHPEIPNLQVAWDSTSMGTLMECPRKYFYTMILGRQPRDESVHLTFGGHYHKALEIYDHGRSAGLDFDAAQLEAVKYCLEATVVRLPNGGFRPWLSDEPTKNRFTLLRTVVWYLEQFKNDPVKTIQLANGKPAVELSFRYESDITLPDGTKFWICGHLDRLGELDGSIYFLDRKTSKQTLSPDTFAKWSPDNQMDLYDFSSNVVYQLPVKGGILDAAQVAVTFSRFARGFLRRNESQRQEWYEDTRYWLTQAYYFAQAGYWPMNRKSCGNYGGCPFRPICAKPPETRIDWLKDTTRLRVWDPLVVRGDI